MRGMGFANLPQRVELVTRWLDGQFFQPRLVAGLHRRSNIFYQSQRMLLICFGEPPRHFLNASWNRLKEMKPELGSLSRASDRQKTILGCAHL
jgi:hypothetical protein